MIMKLVKYMDHMTQSLDVVQHEFETKLFEGNEIIIRNEYPVDCPVDATEAQELEHKKEEGIRAVVKNYGKIIFNEFFPISDQCLYEAFIINENGKTIERPIRRIASVVAN